jgi:hypothetical protein
VRLRARLAVVITSLVLLLGLGAGMQANAAPALPSTATTTPNNGCIVVPSLELALCLGRL